MKCLSPSSTQTQFVDNINLTITRLGNSMYRHLANGTILNSLFQSQLWSIVTSGGYAFHNIKIVLSVRLT